MLDQTIGASKPDSAPNAFYPGIHALRGIAAVLVVVEHGGLFATQAVGVPFTNLLKIDFGALGVLTFFIISGFVMSRIAADEAEILSIVVAKGSRRGGLAQALLAGHLARLAARGVVPSARDQPWLRNVPA